MNKIRKPGEHPGKQRIPGTRPISTKEIRNKKKMERYMSDTAGFISEKLEIIKENYSSSVDLFGVLSQIKKAILAQAEASIKKVNNTEDQEEKISILHQCIVGIVDTMDLAEQNLRLNSLRNQHEVSLLNSLLSELAEATEALKEEGSTDETAEPEETTIPEEVEVEEATN